MSQLVEQWSDFCATGLWRATWQGAVAIGLVWVIARWCTFVSPRIVCWLWRLACLKLLVALVWGAPIGIPLLPTRQAIPREVPAFAAIERPAAASENEVPVEPPRPIVADRPFDWRWAVGPLLLVWLGGALYFVGCTLGEWRVLHRLVRSSRPAPDRLATICAEEASRLGVRRSPLLRLCGQAKSPMLVGIRRPTIVLPEWIEASFEYAEIRLMIAHELAHQNRHDLAWNWLPALTGWLFYFHPLVWLMTRGWSEAQEAACDELLIERDVSQPATYGRLLLKLAAGPADESGSLATAGVLGAYRNLERRMIGLARVRPLSLRRLRWAFCALLLAGTVGIVPWQLTAQETKPAKANAAQPVDPLEQAIAGDPATMRIVKRLRELGAQVQAESENALMASIGPTWQGTAADLRLLNELPNLGSLVVDFADAKKTRKELDDRIGGREVNPQIKELLKRPWKDIDPAVIGALKLKRRLAMLALNKTTDETFAKMQGLPSTRLLSLLQCSCGDAGMARLAKIADGVEELKVQGPFDPANLDRPPAANPKIGDTFLKGVGKIASLNDIELFALPITDAALPHLATLERLKRLEIGSCPDIHGEGFAGLAPVKSLRQITWTAASPAPKGMQTLGQLKQLGTLILTCKTIPAADVAALGGLTNLESLLIGVQMDHGIADHDAALGDAILRAVGQLPKLRSLIVGQISVGDDGLLALSKASALETLALGPMVATDRGLPGLENLTRLKNLALDGQGLTDEAVRHLAGLTALESLTLNDGKVTGSGFSALDTLAHFTSLSITNCPIDDRGCQSLASLHHLESLELTGTQITDRALVSIAKLFLIKTLKLTDAGLTPAGLAKLSPLKELKDLTVANLSEEGLAEVRAALPGAQVNPAGPINGWWTVTGVETLYEARPTDPDDQATDPANNPGNPIGAEGAAAKPTK